MLPFLQAKKMASAVMSVRKQDGTEASRSTEETAQTPHAEMADKLINAVHSKNTAEVAAIIGEIMGSEDAAE